MTYVTGQSRYQTTMLPESLDELIPQDHPVRVIDAFVDSLDLGRLEFKKAITEATGRPPYAPADLLKLYVYGLPESRTIEPHDRARNAAEHGGPVAVDRLAPTYKTIADFRKDHPKAIAQRIAGVALPARR